MNVEIGAKAALFPEKEYINGIAVAVHDTLAFSLLKHLYLHLQSLNLFFCAHFPFIDS
jgi:hypothetical protein